MKKLVIDAQTKTETLVEDEGPEMSTPAPPIPTLEEQVAALQEAMLMMMGGV